MICVQTDEEAFYFPLQDVEMVCHHRLCNEVTIYLRSKRYVKTTEENAEELLRVLDRLSARQVEQMDCD